MNYNYRQMPNLWPEPTNLERKRRGGKKRKGKKRPSFQKEKEATNKKERVAQCIPGKPGGQKKVGEQKEK